MTPRQRKTKKILMGRINEAMANLRTVADIKRDLPDITVRTKSGVLPATVRGRELPFAQVSFGDYGHCEAAWETVLHCIETNSPLICD